MKSFHKFNPCLIILVDKAPNTNRIIFYWIYNICILINISFFLGFYQILYIIGMSNPFLILGYQNVAIFDDLSMHLNLNHIFKSILTETFQPLKSMYFYGYILYFIAWPITYQILNFLLKNKKHSKPSDFGAKNRQPKNNSHVKNGFVSQHNSHEELVPVNHQKQA